MHSPALAADASWEDAAYPWAVIIRAELLPVVWSPGTWILRDIDEAVDETTLANYHSEEKQWKKTYKLKRITLQYSIRKSCTHHIRMRVVHGVEPIL